MQNIFKLMYLNFYYLFVKVFYNLVSKQEDKEEIYQKNNRYVIFVKDDEIAKRLYEVVEALYLNKNLLHTQDANLECVKYRGTRKNSVQFICFEGEINWGNFSPAEKLQKIQYFLEIMQSKGFVLDVTKFECLEGSCISEFLSFFIKTDDQYKIKQAKGSMIEYIHYTLSGGENLKEFYEDIITNNKALYKKSEFPYNLLLAQICYNYIKTGVLPDDIGFALRFEQVGQDDDSYLIAIQDKLDSVFAVTEETDEYTIYNGNLKIYKKVSFEFEEFLKDERAISISKKTAIEQVENIIVDFNNHIIGYKFSQLDRREMKPISEISLENQNEVFGFVKEMVRYLDGCNRVGIETKSGKNDFYIESTLVYKCNCLNLLDSKLRLFNFAFKVKTIKDLFNLSINDRNMLIEQVIVILFNLLSKCVIKKYGQLNNKQQILSTVEIRFLSPVVANEFINFYLGDKANYQLATKELFKHLNDVTFRSGTSFCFDSRFCYHKLEAFVFDYEVEAKYNVKIEKNTINSLPDGRTLVIFNKSKTIESFVNKERDLRKASEEAFGEDKHVKLVGISEIIVSTQRLNNDNMYNVVGYITESKKGVQLTEDALLKLNNKELLYVAGYLFSKFSWKYIPFDNIWMDKNYVFYIDYLNKEVQVERSGVNKGDNSGYVQLIFDHLKDKGYNPNAFAGWKMPSGGYRTTMQYLIDMANSLDMYCDEHGIYYDSKKGLCPVCLETKFLVPQNFEEIFTKLFEDQIAIHYSINDSYNLKVYKPTCENLDKIEANVSKIVDSRFAAHEVDLFQDCFVPCKKALDSNKKFVGYVYDAVEFESIDETSKEVCVELGDVDRLKNLPRLKSLIRLILQVEKITKQNMGFIMNPFSHVFLNTNHKKQVQILNVEFLCSGSDTSETEKWAYDYVCNVLQSDNTIQIRLPKNSPQLHSILDKLTNLAKQMTKYCSIHKMYYMESYLCCPKCVDPKIQSMDITYENKFEYEQREHIGEGGESFIYPYGQHSVAKVFKEGEINSDLKNVVIFKILAKNRILEKINAENHKYKYVIPKKILIDSDSKKVFGYVMDKVEGALPISTLRDKSQVEKTGLSMKDIFEIIITMGEGIEALHKEANIYIGDLNGQNILFDTKKNVYFIDFDGMGVDEISPEFCTDGYIDPLSKNNQNITMQDDWYSFAIQAFYYLTYTHPFNGIYYEKSKDGEKVMLDIVDKMERRISLLGNHGIEVPEIALSWDWMNDELRTIFLNIFEGECRESIVPYLQKQYQALFEKTEKKFLTKIYRINPKFVAKELKIFNGNVVEVINPYTAICEQNQGKYLELVLKCNDEVLRKKIQFQYEPKVNDVLVSEDGKIAVIVLDEVKLIVVDLEQEKEIYFENLSDKTNVVLNDRTIYFKGFSKEKAVIFRRTIQPDGEALKESIRVGEEEIKWFDVKSNAKFVIIRKSTQDTDEVYCNSEKFYTVQYNSEDDANNSLYNIVYDNATKSWLVVNNFGKAIVIMMSGKYLEIDISQYVNDVNLANIDFKNGNIYIPSQECLYIVNVKNGTAKKMECHKIMTPESKLYDINSKGFSVITNNVFYEVRKG